MIYNNILDIIGNTPLVKLNFSSKALIFAKLEYLNPGGSIKDRSAIFMIEEAERNGLLKPGGTIIEASSGNQGIAAAMIGAIKNYKVIITISEKSSQEKIKAIQAYGAQIITCPATPLLTDPESYHNKALAIHKETPNSFMLNQYYNKSNAKAHYSFLGPEIWQQTDGKITHFFAAAGTGGTVSGVGKYLKEQNPNIKVIAIDSNNSYRSTNGNPKPYKLEGLGVDFDAPVLDYSVIDEFITVSDQDSFQMLKALATKHGMLVGGSSGALAYAVEQYSKNLSKNNLAVMVFGDSGRAYLTKNYYTDVIIKPSKVLDLENIDQLSI